MSEKIDYGMRKERYDGQGNKIFVDDTRDIAKFKEYKIAKLKENVNKSLADSDWYVMRKADRGLEVPLEVRQKRAELVNKCDKVESDILLAKSLEELDSINHYIED